MVVSLMHLWLFYLELATHELTNLLGEAVKGYKHDILENSIRNPPLDHNNRLGSIRYRYKSISERIWVDLTEVRSWITGGSARLQYLRWTTITRFSIDIIFRTHNWTLAILWQPRVVYDSEMHKHGSKIIDHRSNMLKSLKDNPIA